MLHGGGLLSRVWLDHIFGHATYSIKNDNLCLQLLNDFRLTELDRHSVCLSARTRRSDRSSLRIASGIAALGGPVFTAVTAASRLSPVTLPYLMNLGRRFCNIINIFLASIRRRFLRFLLSSARSVWRQIRLKTLQTRPKLSGLKSEGTSPPLPPSSPCDLRRRLF